MQKLVQGRDSIKLVTAAITEAGYDSVFLITGQHFQKQNDFRFLQGLSINHFIKPGINVEDGEAKKVFRKFSLNTKQSILAIGGGSVIDLAKAVIYNCIESSLPVPFFAVAPTTAGSGTEATHFAVLYKERKKISIVHPSLLPVFVILDPVLTYSLPAYQTAASGMDALAQAIESYWNVNATKESKEYAAEAILLWRDFFEKAVVSPEPINREKILFAAHLAGKAIDITRTTGPHALSYYLTANHTIPHGQAVALFLPMFFYIITRQVNSVICLELMMPEQLQSLFGKQ
jgi:alcohol dehydrogenase class IV